MLDLVYHFVTHKLRSTKLRETNITACCPFHAENKPSFAIFEVEDGGCRYYCHGCGVSGTLEYLFQVLSIPFYFPKTTTINRKHQKQKTTYAYDHSLVYPKLYFPFRARGLSQETVDKFKLRFDPVQHRFVIPVYHDFVYRGSMYRWLYNKNLRYSYSDLFKPDDILFGKDEINPEKLVVVVEGAIDAMSLTQCGIQSVAIINRATINKKDFTGFNNIVYLPDNDTSGTQTARQCKLPTIFLPRNYKDFNQMLCESQKDTEKWLVNAIQ
jgi:5S rRNA maturation endonuclease (ribonuclease M5)